MCGDPRFVYVLIYPIEHIACLLLIMEEKLCHPLVKRSTDTIRKSLSKFVMNTYISRHCKAVYNEKCNSLENDPAPM